jgi:hypothetical protein
MIASLLGAALFAACTSESTAPSAPELARGRNDPANFTKCYQQSYASSSGWIGPRGGTLRAGKNVLRVPPGALTSDVFITMETTADNINHVVFGPDGLVFNPRSLPTLVMSYQGCRVAADAEQRIVYVSESLEIIEPTPSQSDPVSQTVEGKLSHFSNYVLSTYAVVY